MGIEEAIKTLFDLIEHLVKDPAGTLKGLGWAFLILVISFALMIIPKAKRLPPNYVPPRPTKADIKAGNRRMLVLGLILLIGIILVIWAVMGKRVVVPMG